MTTSHSALTQLSFQRNTTISQRKADGSDDDDAMLKQIREDVINILIPRVKAQLGEKVLALFSDDIKYFVNPTGNSSSAALMVILV